MTRNNVITAVCFSLLLPGIAATTLAQVPQDPAAALKLPNGNWSLAVRPSSIAGHDVLPFDVFSVRTHARMGMAVTRVGLLNRSTEEVIAVKLYWELHRLPAIDNRPLESGTTALVVLSQALNPGEAILVNAPFVSFATLLRQLVPANTTEPQDAFAIEISVLEARFADGGSWRSTSAVVEAPDQETAIGEVELLSADKLRESGCPDQACIFDGRLQCYICESNLGSYCALESCLACTTGWCLNLGGGQGGQEKRK